MPPSLEQFSQAIDRWDECAARAESAYAERDYAAFQQAFREAERQFGIIRRGISDNLHNEAGFDRSTQLARIAGRWDELATQMQTWRDELQERLTQAKKQLSRGNKIRKGYAAKQKTTGRNLRLRAT